MNGVYFALSDLQILVAPMIAAAELGPLSTPGPWSPPEWRQIPSPATIVVPASVSQVQSKVTDGTGNTLSGNSLQSQAQGSATNSTTGSVTIYAFDCVQRIEHVRELVTTRHPIQTSASSPVSSISDHAYQQIPRITLEIGVSDAMASYYANTWTGARSKSISAYETLIDLLEQRTLVTLTTRLATYSNVIVKSVNAPDDVKTLHGLRATIVFEQMFLASATAVGSTFIASSDDSNSATAVSARPNATDSTPSGAVQSVTPSAALTQQNNITSTNYATLPSFPSVPGAGNWSSSNVGQLGQL
jgi:hypothetical protein